MPDLKVASSLAMVDAGVLPRALAIGLDLSASRPRHVDASVATTTRANTASEVFILLIPKNAGRRRSPARILLAL
jgi:hypothetical protein